MKQPGKRFGYECARIRKLLDAFADAELNGRQRDTVAAHLRRCEPCREELDSIATLAGALRELPHVPPESDLSTCVRSRLENSLSKQRLYGRRYSYYQAQSYGQINAWANLWKYAAYTACATAVVVIGFWTSWTTGDELLNLLRTTRAARIMPASADCYIAHNFTTNGPLQCHDVSQRQQENGIDSKEVQADPDTAQNMTLRSDNPCAPDDTASALAESMGLQTDEEGLYAVEM